MTPDVHAVRTAALAHLGLPADCDASFDTPAIVGAFVPPPVGWVRVARVRRGRTLSAMFPWAEQAMPRALRVVAVSTRDDGIVEAAVYVHCAVLLLRGGEPRGPWRIPTDAPARLQLLRAAVSTPGALDAAVHAYRVGGVPGALHTLRALTGGAPP